MKRLFKTTAAGGAGYLAGLLLEQGLETLTGLEFVDGIFAVGGAVLSAASVNKDMIKTAELNIRQRFGKGPLEISKDEWELYKRDNPKTAMWLEKALGV